MPRVKTPNRGAADIISGVIRKVKSMAKGSDDGMIYSVDLIIFLQNWDVRAAAKKGGLGKR